MQLQLPFASSKLAVHLLHCCRGSAALVIRTAAHLNCPHPTRLHARLHVRTAAAAAAHTFSSAHSHWSASSTSMILQGKRGGGRHAPHAHARYAGGARVGAVSADSQSPPPPPTHTGCASHHSPPQTTHLAEKAIGKSAEKAVMSQAAPYSIGTTPQFSRCWLSLGEIRRLSCHSWTCRRWRGECLQREAQREFGRATRQWLCACAGDRACMWAGRPSWWCASGASMPPPPCITGPAPPFGLAVACH